MNIRRQRNPERLHHRKCGLERRIALVRKLSHLGNSGHPFSSGDDTECMGEVCGIISPQRFVYEDRDGFR